MAHVGDKFLANIFELFEACEIVKDKYLALLGPVARGDDRGVDLQEAAWFSRNFDLCFKNRFFFLQPFFQRGEFRGTEGLRNRLATNLRRKLEELAQRFV